MSKELKIYGSNGGIRILEDDLNVRPFTKGVYNLDIGLSGCFFEKLKDNFELPKKENIYSNDELFIKHVLYKVDNANEDVNLLLQGERGLGKSFTAKIIANEISDKYDCPIILITSNHGLIEKLSYLNKLTIRYILFIDEIDKIFPTEYGTDADNPDNPQNKFLSFLDGSLNINNKKIIIVTANEQLSKYFYNRPSRFRYVRKYEYLSTEIASQIIMKELHDKKFAKDILDNINNNCNIDVLKQIIQEVNLLNVPYSSFKEYFNHSKTYNDSTEYILKVNDPVFGKFDLKTKMNGSNFLLKQTYNVGFRIGLDSEISNMIESVLLDEYKKIIGNKEYKSKIIETIPGTAQNFSRLYDKKKQKFIENIIYDHATLKSDGVSNKLVLQLVDDNFYQVATASINVSEVIEMSNNVYSNTLAYNNINF